MAPCPGPRRAADARMQQIKIHRGKRHVQHAPTVADRRDRGPAGLGLRRRARRPPTTIPNKPIKLIVAAAAGGPTDVPARLASQILQHQARPAGGGREPAGRRRRARRAGGRDRAAGRLHAAHGQHQHARGDSRRCRPAPATIRSRISCRSSGSPRASRSWWCIRRRPGRRSRSSSTTPRPIRARSTTPTPAPAACRIWPASCSCCAAAPR